jgi:hypothetical protein
MRQNIESSKEGLVALHRHYNSGEDQHSDGFSMMACFAAYFGDLNFSLEALENSNNYWVIWLPVMYEVRQTLRFKEFVREIGIVDYWKEYGWPDLCHPVGDGDFECD